jgi:(5-formylfuran-3-yl)methyl phosphate synthase
MSDYRTSRLRLLVSVANAAEVSAALAGGADVIDAKNPLAGALGAVSAETLREIHATVAGARLVTAAIGDAADEAALARTASTFAAAGAALVKVGFAGITSASRVEMLIRAAVRGVRAIRPSTGSGRPELVDGRLKPDPTGVVAVAYADADPIGAFVDVAARAGATGVLLDTADKSGPGLRALMTPAALARWVAYAHESGLLVAVAGKLTAEDLAFAHDAGADIAGVRGAACEGGRCGRVSSDRVALLRALCNPAEAGSHVRADARTR